MLQKRLVLPIMGYLGKDLRLYPMSMGSGNRQCNLWPGCNSCTKKSLAMSSQSLVEGPHMPVRERALRYERSGYTIREGPSSALTLASLTAPVQER